MSGALALGLALAVGTSNWTSGRDTSEARPFCDFPGTYTDWSDLTYKGVRMVMPTAYEIEERRVRNGRSVDGIGGHYVAVWVDDFAPILSRDSREMVQDPSWLRFLINELKPVWRLARISAGLYSNHPASPDERPPITAYPLVPGPHGLTEIAFKGTIAEREARDQLRGFWARALYVDRGLDGRAELVVECTHEDVLVQLCKQFFEVDPFTITMTYKRSQLPNWDCFRRDTERLIACANEFGERAEAGERF